MVMAIILALLAIAALETAQRLSIFIVHAIATGIAAWYCWRIADVSRALLGRSVASVQSDPATTWIRDAIQSGQFGKVNMIRGHFGGFKRPRNDSGVMFADGIHFVDLFNYVLGATPKSVLDRKSTRLNSSH